MGTIIFLLLLLGAFNVFLVVARKQGKQFVLDADNFLYELMEAQGAELVPVKEGQKKNFPKNLTIQKPFGEIFLTLNFVAVRRGTKLINLWELELEMLQDNPTELIFTIFPEKTFLPNPYKKVISKRDIKIGNPSFDEEFIVRSNDEEFPEKLSRRFYDLFMLLCGQSGLPDMGAFTFAEDHGMKYRQQSEDLIEWANPQTISYILQIFAELTKVAGKQEG